MNRSFVEELVFEECRYPYMFQLNNGYRLSRLVFFVFEVVLGFVAAFLVGRYRKHERFVIRAPSTFVVALASHMASAIGFTLVEYSSETVSILNSCQFIQIFTGFATATGSGALFVRVVLYFNAFKLYDTVRGGEHGVSESLSKLFYKASRQYARILSLTAFMFSVMFASIVALVSCPIGDTSVFVCEHQQEFDPVTYGRFTVLGIILLVCYIFISRRTRTYPDPYGVLLEVKMLLVVFFTTIIVSAIYAALSVGPVDTFDLKFTVGFFASVFNVLVLLLTVYYPAYLIWTKQSVSITLKEVLSKPESKRLFEMHLSNELSLEVLQCYEAIIEFKSKAAQKGRETMRSLAKNIYVNFIDLDTAEYPINISYAMRETATKDVMQGRFSVDMFDDISQQLLNTLHLDLFPRFQRGPYYALFVGLSDEDTFEKLQNL